MEPFLGMLLDFLAGDGAVPVNAVGVDGVDRFKLDITWLSFVGGFVAETVVAETNLGFSAAWKNALTLFVPEIGKIALGSRNFMLLICFVTACH
jgi:hypothetical protein